MRRRVRGVRRWSLLGQVRYFDEVREMDLGVWVLSFDKGITRHSYKSRVPNHRILLFRRS